MFEARGPTHSRILHCFDPQAVRGRCTASYSGSLTQCGCHYHRLCRRHYLPSQFTEDYELHLHTTVMIPSVGNHSLITCSSADLVTPPVHTKQHRTRFLPRLSAAHLTVVMLLLSYFGFIICTASVTIPRIGPRTIHATWLPPFFLNEEGRNQPCWLALAMELACVASELQLRRTDPLSRPASTSNKEQVTIYIVFGKGYTNLRHFIPILHI